MESAGLFYTFGHWRQLKLIYTREQEGDAMFSTSWCLRNGTYYKTVNWKMHGMSREIGYSVKASFPRKKSSLHYGNQKPNIHNYKFPFYLHITPLAPKIIFRKHNVFKYTGLSVRL